MAEIITYDKKYLEQHVSLGQKLTKNWDYFGQTPFNIMEKQYNKLHFDPATRFYVLDDENLVGFQTSQILPEEKTKARMEFPIIKSSYSFMIPKLMEMTESVLKDKDVNIIRSRASKFWGKTQQYAKDYNFEPVEDLYYVSTFNLDDINRVEESNHFKLEEYNSVFHAQEVKNILMNWLDTSESLADAYIEAMKTPQDSTLAHLIIIDQEKVQGRLAVSKFDNNGEINCSGSIFVNGDHDKSTEILTTLFNEFIIRSEKNKVTDSTLYITGGKPSKFGVDEYGITYDPVITFYEKRI